MRPPTPNPTETSLGVFNEREDLLEQVARKSHVARWGRAIARLAVVFSVVVLAVLLFGPPSGTTGWIGSPESAYYLFGFMLDACFAVGSGMLYTIALQGEDPLVAGASAFSLIVSCVGAAICLTELVV